jgi:hypothetical protein
MIKLPWSSTNAIVTEKGFQTLAEAAPGHVHMCDQSSSTSCPLSSCGASAAKPTA